jgi:hypothetical protein
VGNYGGASGDDQTVTVLVNALPQLRALDLGNCAEWATDEGQHVPHFGAYFCKVRTAALPCQQSDTSSNDAMHDDAEIGQLSRLRDLQHLDLLNEDTSDGFTAALATMTGVTTPHVPAAWSQNRLHRGFWPAWRVFSHALLVFMSRYTPSSSIEGDACLRFFRSASASCMVGLPSDGRSAGSCCPHHQHNGTLPRCIRAL